MFKRKVNVSGVSGWAGTAAGAFNAHTVTVDLPVGPRYHALWIYGHAGAAKKFTDLIGECRILVNGTPQRTFTGTELLKLNGFNNSPNSTMGYAGRNGNVAATAFQVPIWFAEPWRKSLRSQDALAWGTGDIGSFQLQIDILAYAGAAAGLIAPTFKAEIDNVKGADGKPQRLGIFTKWKKMQIPITAANAFTDWLGLGFLSADNAIQSLHLSDANVSEFELLVNENMARKDTTAGNATGLAAREMNPDPTATNDCPARAMYDIVADHDDILENVLPLTSEGRKVESVNLRLMDNGGTVSRNISTIVQLIGPAE